MKKKILILIIIIALILAGVFLYTNGKNQRLKQIEKEKENRYIEIKETVKKGIEWNLKAMYPNCPIVDILPEAEYYGGTHYNAYFLISNGYIKQEDLLDYDGKSYCDIFVKVNNYKKNPMDEQHDCNVSYKLYLKCDGYTEKGYQDWGKK